MKILFWNTHGNMNIDTYILGFMEENPCDIIILAEYPNNINGLCNLMSLYSMDFYPWNTIACNTIKIISQKYYQHAILQDEKRYCLYSLKTAYNNYIITVLHLPSKLHYDSSDTESYARRIKSDIETAEKTLGHHRTFVIGDFNVNPFEHTCINADCFHALPNSIEAKKGVRTVSGHSFTTFYNPMWNLFGDFDGVGGTYFYNKNQIHSYQWNIYDQVILRPELINCFVKKSLKIIDTIKGKSILNNKGRPDSNISDHLPIFFEIREEM